jgi:sugar lactone lactonase YvrE
MFEQAIAVSQAEENMGQRAWGEYNLGRALAAGKEMGLARIAFRKAVARDPFKVSYVEGLVTNELDAGQFDEPVGITVDKNGTVYVVDTWNQRVQTFTRVETDGALTFMPAKQWDVYGWFGQSVDNKPFIAVNDDLHVFITDPDGFRVMEFDPNGELLRTWGDFGDSAANFGSPSGITIDSEGHIWVTDSLNNRIMRFTLP